MPRVLQTPSEPEPGETIIRRTKTTTYSHGRAWLPWLAALALVPLALALLYLYPFGGKDRIQDDLSAKARTALAGASIPNAGVRFNGADAVLCGVPDNLLDRAREAVRDVGGVNAVRAATAGDTACGPSGGGSARQPATVKMAVQDGRVILTGTVPDTAAADAMTQAATAAANGLPVDNQLTVQPDATMALSAANLGTMAGALAAVSGNRQLEWNGSTLILTGTAPDEAGKTQLQEQISAIAPSFALDNQLTVAPTQGAPSASGLGMSVQDGRLVLTGTVPSEAAKAELIAAATAAAPGRAIDDQITVDPGASLPVTPAELGAMAGAISAAPGSPQLRWNGTQLVLSGSVPSDADKESLEQALTQIAPSVSIDNQLTVSASTAPALTSEEKAALQQQIATLLQQTPIGFEPDSATLTAAGQQAVAAIAALLAAAPGATVEIAGHVASVSSPADGQILSLQRADAVKAVLTGEGISADRLVTQGFGDTQPVASNDTPEGQAVNRRVEITVR